jgi:hypothetical protein
MCRGVQDKFNEELAAWKIKKEVWEQDIVNKHQAIQEINKQQKAAEEKRKEEQEKMKASCYVEKQNWNTAFPTCIDISYDTNSDNNNTNTNDNNNNKGDTKKYVLYW